MNGLTFAALVLLLFAALVSLCPRAPDERSGENDADAGKPIDNGG